MTRDDSLTLRTCEALRDMAPDAWDALANPPDRAYNPFVSWAFLEALERSGSAAAETGWAPQHLILEDDDGPVGAVPAYAKGHSYGEYVFDHGWAEAFERAGGRYYPKYQIMAPFTPATGPRLLTKAGASASRVKTALAQGIGAVIDALGLSSAHATFLHEEEQTLLAGQGWLARDDQQFHFRNRGYRDFQDFLDALSSRKRKNLRKEREKAVENDVTIRHVTGADITEAHWDAFFEFYTDTGARKWGRPYLKRPFFSLVGERMADRILLVFAERDGRPIAGALNFIGGDALYGRHWGCVEHHPFLHFEVCYYQAIDFALAHGLDRVEAGAQGAHKLARGYEPVTVRSAHLIAHEGLREAVAHYLERERLAVAHEIEIMGEHAPFKKSE